MDVMPTAQQLLHAQPQKLGRRASVAVGLHQQLQGGGMAQQRARRQSMAVGARLNNASEASSGRQCYLRCPLIMGGYSSGSFTEVK